MENSEFVIQVGKRFPIELPGSTVNFMSSETPDILMICENGLTDREVDNYLNGKIRFGFMRFGAAMVTAFTFNNSAEMICPFNPCAIPPHALDCNTADGAIYHRVMTVMIIEKSTMEVKGIRTLTMPPVANLAFTTACNAILKSNPGQDEVVEDTLRILDKTNAQIVAEAEMYVCGA